MEFTDTQAGILTNAWLLSRAGCGQVLDVEVWPDASAQGRRLARTQI